MATYDNPLRITYTLTAVSVASAADLLDIVGPVGLQGRVVAIAAVVTTGNTTAAGTIDVGSAGDDNAFAVLTIPIASADAVYNNPSLLTTDSNLIPANTRAIISSDGGGTAGVVDAVVVIDWF